jgi:acyl-CoA hydrolase
MSKSDWTKTEICQGYFFMIAIDSMMRPIPIPQFNPESDEQKADWDTAQAIREHMLSQRNK